ncbi:MAG: hypothetical protein KJ927_02870, partial [Candidatus Eisenbacteria bacterium]|nr:hypothetical protein [Candidatus Eisenbacteria bacterium]
MRCYIRCLLFIILGVCLTSRLDAGDAPAKQQVHRPGHAAMRLWIEAAAETLYLPHHHIEPHSLAMEWMGRRWLCGDSLRLEPSLGFLILPFAAPAADSAVIEYNYLPIDLPVMYSHRRIEESTGGEAPKVVEERKSPRNAQPDTKLNISGSKTFSVEMGSQQDLAVDQTLDLTITGRVSSNVKVQAILTDRETPLQPEGTTRELEDLDKVYLRIEAPDAQLDLGDLEIEESGLRLASFQRQLEGVDGRVRIGSHETHAVGAVSRGRFRSLEFFGAEGRQGPYALLGREEDGVIVAGSEVVWLDGQKLQRGETESYIIDYSLGELTFTSRHPMSERSEIVVDFEVSLESYRRSLYSLALRSVIPGSRGLWRILYLREQDDRAHPLGLVLSDEESSLLEEVGDGIAPGLDSGIQYVGPLHGDYAKVEVDTVSQAIFRYMGPDSGSYVVHFVEVGDGSGDYLEAHTYGVTYYVYAGENKGDYKPGRAVPRPVALEVGDISLVLERGLARVEAEGAFSRYDRNAFSDKDDGDNVDGAYTINTTLKSPMLRILGGEIGHFETRLRARQVGDRYQAPGRLQSGFYEKEWNAPSGTLNGREREQGAELRLVATEKVNVGAGWDRLESWSGFEARRLTADFAMASWARLEGRMTRVASEDSIGLKGERSTERIRVADKNGRLDFTYLRENSTWGKGATATGYQFRDLDATVRRGQPDRGLNLRARINWRRYWLLDGGKEQRDNDGLTTELESEWMGTPSLRAGALFVRRKLHSYAENPGRTTYLGQ